MAEVFFYHLTRSPLQQALPELLERVMSRGWRALVRGVDEDRMRWLDEVLWQGRGESFLAHGLAGGSHDNLQPVLLSTDAKNRNQAEILLLVDGARITATEVADYTRVCLMFDGNDVDSVNAAREDWKMFTDAGIAAQYWAQEDGSWVKKAEKSAN